MEICAYEEYILKAGRLLVYCVLFYLLFIAIFYTKLMQNAHASYNYTDTELTH